MAKFNQKTMSSLYVVLVLSLLLTFSVTESKRTFGSFGVPKKPLGGATPSLICESVYGAQKGDTCDGVAQMFDLTTDFFLSINPNINCATIFVNQWLCTDGTVV